MKKISNNHCANFLRFIRMIVVLLLEDEERRDGGEQGNFGQKRKLKLEEKRLDRLERMEF